MQIFSSFSSDFVLLPIPAQFLDVCFFLLPIQAYVMLTQSPAIGNLPAMTASGSFSLDSGWNKSNTLYLPGLARHCGHRVASWIVGEKVPWRGSVFMSPPPLPPCPFDLPMSRLCFLSVMCNSVWPYFKRLLTALPQLGLSRSNGNSTNVNLNIASFKKPLWPLYLETIFAPHKFHYTCLPPCHRSSSEVCCFYLGTHLTFFWSTIDQLLLCQAFYKKEAYLNLTTTSQEVSL